MAIVVSMVRCLPLEPPPRMLRSRVRSSWELSVFEDDVGTRGGTGRASTAILGASVRRRKGGSSVTLFSLIFGSGQDAHKKLLPLFYVALVPVVFIVAFAFFAQLNPAQQAMSGPLWLLIKMLLKKLGTWLVDKGKSPEAAPFMLFALDAVAAMCGNFLFLSASEMSSVFTMISVDVVENLSCSRREQS